MGNYGVINFWIHQRMDLLNKYENVFNIVLIVSDFMYLPLALSLGIFRILFWLCFALFSYMRPDINMYPRGLEDWDLAHVAFVSTVQMVIDREKKFMRKYEDRTLSEMDDLKQEDTVAVSTIYHSL